MSPRSLRARRGLLGALAASLISLPAYGADPVGGEWVTEGLQVGLHEDANLDSAITALLKSGVELEVLERSGTLVRVRASDGSEGWMDARYVAEEPPAIVLLQSAQVALVEAETRITALGKQVGELEARAAELDERNGALDTERAALSVQLEAERAKLAELEADRDEADRERSRLQAELDSMANTPQTQGDSLSNALRDIQRLAEENRGLKQELAILEANQELVATAGEGLDPLPALEPEPEPEASAPAEESAGAEPDDAPLGQPNLLGFLRWQAWQWMLLGSGLLLSFGAGGWLVDYTVRRRHGGFRI